MQFPLKETWDVTKNWAWCPKVYQVEEKPGKMKLMTREPSSQFSKSPSTYKFSSPGWGEGIPRNIAANSITPPVGRWGVCVLNSKGSAFVLLLNSGPLWNICLLPKLGSLNLLSGSNIPDNLPPHLTPNLATPALLYHVIPFLLIIIQSQMFIEHLLYSRYCSQYRG